MTCWAQVHWMVVLEKVKPYHLGSYYTTKMLSVLWVIWKCNSNPALAVYAMSIYTGMGPMANIYYEGNLKKDFEKNQNTLEIIEKGLDGKLVSVFVVLAIFIGGAAVGCWIVRKFVLSEDGSVDAGTAQFVKWAMRVIAIVSILLSTSDTALKIAALCCCWGASFLLKFRNWQGETSKQLVCSTKRSLWQPKVKHAHRSLVRPEFLSRPPRMAPWRTGLDNKGSPHSWSKSPTKGLVISSPCKRSSLWESEFDHEDYYSTFHKTPVRKRFSKRDWEDFTRESTKDAMAKLASSPEFTDWVIEHSDRIQVLPDDSSDDGSMGSRSDSSEETAAEGNGSGLSFFKWY